MAKLRQKFRLDSDTRVILTSHLFYKRKNENRSRIAVFRNSFQILDIIKYAIKEFDLLSYKDKGKLALIVPVYERKFTISKYGVAISVETSKDTCNYKTDIIVITIDKQDTRHYKDSLQLVKSKYRFYLDNYCPTKSFVQKDLIFLNKVTCTLGNAKIFITPFFQENKNYLFDFFPKGYINFFASVFGNEIPKRLNRGAFWCLVTLKDQKQFYIRMAIEESWDKNEFLIIVLNGRYKSQKTLNLINRFQEEVCEYSFLDIKMPRKGRGNGLKIIRKKSMQKLKDNYEK